MAPTNDQLVVFAKRALVTAGPAISSHYLASRDLTVRGAQGVTLGVIAVYVVAIAILWNIPYLHYVLWPFKVCSPPSPKLSALLTFYPRC